MEAEYCDECGVPVSHVCMHVTCVCLFACSSQEPHVQTSPKFICMLPTTITQSSSFGSFVIRYGSLVSCIHRARNRPIGDALCRPVFRLHTDLTLWCCVYTKPDSTGDPSADPRGAVREAIAPPLDGC